jgi:hypothetical protein
MRYVRNLFLGLLLLFTAAQFFVEEDREWFPQLMDEFIFVSPVMQLLCPNVFSAAQSLYTGTFTVRKYTLRKTIEQELLDINRAHAKTIIFDNIRSDHVHYAAAQAACVMLEYVLEQPV